MALKYDMCHWPMENQAFYADIFAQMLCTNEPFLNSEMLRYAKNRYDGKIPVYWTTITVANLAYYALHAPPHWRPHFLHEYARLMTYIEDGPHDMPSKYVSCHS